MQNFFIFNLEIAAAANISQKWLILSFKINIFIQPAKREISPIVNNPNICEREGWDQEFNTAEDLSLKTVDIVYPNVYRECNFVPLVCDWWNDPPHIQHCIKDFLLLNTTLILTSFIWTRICLATDFYLASTMHSIFISSGISLGHKKEMMKCFIQYHMLVHLNSEAV